MMKEQLSTPNSRPTISSKTMITSSPLHLFTQLNPSTNQLINPLKTIILIIAITLLTTAPSCYSLKGTSIPIDIETVTVNLFENQASIVMPTLSQTFTESLKDKFSNESRLAIVDNEGDWEFSGAITQYQITPIAPTGNETTALNLSLIHI